MTFFVTSFNKEWIYFKLGSSFIFMSLGDLGFKKVRNSREDNDIKSTKMMKMFFFVRGGGEGNRR